MGYTNCWGIDLSEAHVLYGTGTLGLGNLEKADALDWLEGRRAAFECILAIDILEHVETDDLLALGGKIREALRPGGTLVAQVANGMAPLNPVGWGDVTHVRSFNAESIRQFFRLVGLVPVGCWEIPPHLHGLKSAARRALWTGLLRPLLPACTLAAYGETAGGIFTANLLAVAVRPSS